jgi:hypothetical protein
VIELDAVLEDAVVNLALALRDDAVAGPAEKQRLYIGGKTAVAKPSAVKRESRA